MYTLYSLGVKSNFQATAQTPSGDSGVVASFYGRFGVTFTGITRHVPVRASVSWLNKLSHTPCKRKKVYISAIIRGKIGCLQLFLLSKCTVETENEQ